MTETSAAAASSEALRYSPRGARSRFSGISGASSTFSIHWLRSENRYADSGGGSFCRAPCGRCGIEFFEAAPDEIPEAFAIKDADWRRRARTGRGSSSGCWQRSAILQGRNDRERRCRFAQSLGIDPRLEDGLREQGHETVQAFGSDFAFDD